MPIHFTIVPRVITILSIFGTKFCKFLTLFEYVMENNFCLNQRRKAIFVLRDDWEEDHLQVFIICGRSSITALLSPSRIIPLTSNIHYSMQSQTKNTNSISTWVLFRCSIYFPTTSISSPLSFLITKPRPAKRWEARSPSILTFNQQEGRGYHALR